MENEIEHRVYNKSNSKKNSKSSSPSNSLSKSTQSQSNSLTTSTSSSSHNCQPTLEHPQQKELRNSVKDLLRKHVTRTKSVKRTIKYLSGTKLVN